MKKCPYLLSIILIIFFTSTIFPQNFTAEEIKKHYTLGKKYEKKQKHTQAFDSFLKAAQEGYVHAQEKVADYYNTGKGDIQQDTVKALLWYKKAASQESAKGSINLVNISIQERLSQQCINEALTYVFKIAHKGNGEALYTIANLCREGKYLKQNFSKAVEYYTLAIEQDTLGARANLGIMYLIGEGVAQDTAKGLLLIKADALKKYNLAIKILAEFYDKSGDYKEAFIWYIPLAEQDNIQALYRLSCLYSYTFEIDKDQQKIAPQNISSNNTEVQIIFTDSSFKFPATHAYQPTEKDISRGYYLLGEVYYKGHYYPNFPIKKDALKAYKYYKKALNLKYFEALAAIALLYQRGEQNGDKIIIKQDLKKAVKLYEEAVAHNVTIAETRLGALYLTGTEIPNNISRGIELLTKVADKGISNPSIYSTLGYWWCNSNPKLQIEPNYTKAQIYLEKALALNDPKAGYVLGCLYKEGCDEIQIDYKKAASCYEHSARLGDVESQNSLGIMYDTGKGVPQSTEKALYWFHNAAHNKSGHAFYNLGQLYEKGSGVPVDRQKAYHYFRQGAYCNHDNSIIRWASYTLEDKLTQQERTETIKYLKTVTQGKATVDAPYIIARIYKASSGTDKDYYKKALKYFNKAAELGHPDACIILAHMYLKQDSKYTHTSKALSLIDSAIKLNFSKGYTLFGILSKEGSYMPQNKEIALDYLQQAAQKEDAEALYQLGLFLLNTPKTAVDYKAAYNYLEGAARKNHKHAQFIVGDYYNHINKPAYAYPYYRKSALNGNKDALIALAYMYKCGIGVKPDAKRAFKLLNKCAEQPALYNAVVQAQVDLGYCYEQGINCKANQKMAQQFYLKAGFNNYLPALSLLAKRYLYGIGIPSNREKSKYWFNRAAEQGDLEAISYLENLS